MTSSFVVPLGERLILVAKDTQQKRSEVVVDFKKIMAGQSADIPLLAGDVLVVPGSTGKHAVYRALEAAVTAGTFIASYGVYH